MGLIEVCIQLSIITMHIEFNVDRLVFICFSFMIPVYYNMDFVSVKLRFYV